MCQCERPAWPPLLTPPALICDGSPGADAPPAFGSFASSQNSADAAAPGRVLVSLVGPEQAPPLLLGLPVIDSLTLAVIGR